MSDKTLISKILDYDDIWCNMLGIFNPYIDPFKTQFTSELPMYDIVAYRKYPIHNFVYDKLWIAKSQGLDCGELESLSIDSKVKYPIFIKPRWGHKSASSKNCFKINSFDEATPYLTKEDMIWTEFIDAQETMTDYIMLDGVVMYQMTLIYSEKQNGFIDDYKYISEDNRPPHDIDEWVNKHMNGYSGICNVQYRGTKIIEVSLRLSRGGAYMKSTNNTHLIENINNVVEHGTWDYSYGKKMDYKPFYSFKCYTTSPILYLLPQYLLDSVMSIYKCKPFYEYFFEPSGKRGMVFFQFLHKDFNKGMKCKQFLEHLFSLIQYIFIILLMIVIVLLIIPTRSSFRNNVIIVFVVLYMTKVFNPLSAHYSLFKVQRQQWFG